MTDPQIHELDSDFDEAHPTSLSPLVDAFKNKKKREETGEHVLYMYRSS